MITDMEASLRFYVDGLGFTKTLDWKPNGRIEWCELQNGGAAIMLQEYRPGRRPAGKLGVGFSVCFMCEDALKIYRDTRARGISAEKRPFVGNRLWVVQFKDPDGYDICFESPADAPEESELPD